MKRCTVFSAGPDDCKWIDHIHDKGYVIAADGGYLLASRHNVVPDLAVGDFDTAPKPDDMPTVSFAAEKDDTDTGIAVRYGLAKGCNQFLFFGCTGGLLDHTLANIAQLISLTQYDAVGWMIDNRSAATVCREGEVRFSCDIGTRFSVFPLDGPCTVSYTNAKYPLKDHTLTCDHPLGVSNESTGETVTVQVTDGMALIIISDFSNTFVDSVYNEVTTD